MDFLSGISSSMGFDVAVNNFLPWLSFVGLAILVFIFIFYLSVFLAPPSVQTRKKNSPSSSPVVNKKDRKGSKPGELTGKLYNTITGRYKGIVCYVR